MTTERLQRRIEQFLDQADEAMVKVDWQTVHDREKAVHNCSPPEQRDEEEVRHPGGARIRTSILTT